MWKKPAKIFLGILLVLLLLLASAVLLAFAFEDKIKAKIVAEINEQVKVPVQVKGGITLSLLRHFPYAALTFTEVSIDDKLLGSKHRLMSVHEFSFLCNVFSLLSNEIEFSKVLVKDGELNLYKDESGKTNFDILKESKKGNESKLSVQLKKAEINNVHFVFTDKTQSITVDVALNAVALKGNFSDDNFDLESKTRMMINRLTAGGEDFLHHINLQTELTLEVDKLKKRYNFKDGKITANENEFGISGYFMQLKSGTQLDFKLRSEGKDIQKLVALIPEKYRQNLANADGTGEYVVDGAVKGLLGKFELPVVRVEASLKNSELRLGKYNKYLKNVNATAQYSADASGNDKLVISNFNCTLNDLPFDFKLTLEKLSNPAFDFYANGTLHLDEISSFIPDSIMNNLGGTITFSNFHLKGRKDDFTDVQNSTLTGSGQFKLSEIEFQANGVTYGNMNGLLKYENEIIEAQNFTLNFLSTDFNFTGSIKNLFAFVYNLSAKRTANNIVLGVAGKIKTETFNLTNILDAYSRKNRAKAVAKDKINIREIFSMSGNLEIEMDKFLFRQMEFDALHANLLVTPGNVHIQRLSAKAMKGDLQVNGDINFMPENSLNINCNVNATALDIPEIFSQCESFGQNTLTEKNLKGTITSTLTFDATWRNYKELDKNSLTAIIDFKISNGELIHFEPLRAASKFIRVEELDDIRFADLANTIKIANGRLDVPEFEIKTSALNLLFFGYTYFDNTIDYHLKINLHKLLAQKFKRQTETEQYIESDPYEGVNLYLTMSGKLDNPKIKYDKASVRKKIQNDFKQEKENLKNLLKNNAVKQDENERKREEKYFEMKEQPVFMDLDSVSN